MTTGFSGSYAPEDVTFLLERVTLDPVDVATKEALIQSGARHYSEMLSPETPPSPEYLALYEAALDRNGARLAHDIAALAGSLDARAAAGREVVLVSLVRAGTPIAILIARAIKRRGGRSVAHYGVSIIRDRGIDSAALAYVARHHDPADIVFVDGWTGKGAIAGELCRSVPDGIAPFLAVVADPAGIADLAATHDDYLIASGLLNSVVSGLVSRTILKAELSGGGAFHACMMFNSLAAHDRSRGFIDRVDAMVGVGEAIPPDATGRQAANEACEAMLAHIMADARVTNRNLVKPGIAEATRVFLRRVPERLYLRDATDPDVRHLVHLATEKKVPIAPLDAAGHFRAVAVIREVSP